MDIQPILHFIASMTPPQIIGAVAIILCLVFIVSASTHRRQKQIIELHMEGNRGCLTPIIITLLILVALWVFVLANPTFTSTVNSTINTVLHIFKH